MLVRLRSLRKATLSVFDVLYVIESCEYESGRGICESKTEACIPYYAHDRGEQVYLRSRV